MRHVGGGLKANFPQVPEEKNPLRYTSCLNRLNCSTISTIMFHVLTALNIPPIDTDSRYEGLGPPHLDRLPPREREVARIVYDYGACTANQVQALLATPISNGAIRSMLVRLIRKDILRRRWGARGRGREHVYMPALMPSDVQRHVLLEVSEKFFEGSLKATVLMALDLLDSDSRASLLCSLDHVELERTA